VSHFRVTVCLPPTPPQEVHAALDAAMAPFDINAPDDLWTPDGQWDHWHIDAGDDGRRFAYRPECDGDPRLIFEPTYPSGAPRERLPFRCDGGPRGLLDFDATREAAVAWARAYWLADQDSKYPSARELQPTLDEAAAWAIATYALLTVDGQWRCVDWPGSFAEPLPGESSSDAYARQATAYLEELDQDCVIVGLYCHG
jgi:hypothetical protein